jgi:hypothetical protein
VSGQNHPFKGLFGQRRGMPARSAQHGRVYEITTEKLSVGYCGQ